MQGTLVKRYEKLAFYGVPGENGGTATYHRMKGFTELSISKNPKEYSRQYVDEKTEQTDITGYSTSISYAFDRYEGQAVHEDIIRITDDELVGDEAVRTIIVVDMTDGNNTAGYSAVKRDFAVVPDSEGSSLDAYTYSGSFKARGESETVTVTISGDTLTIKTGE